MRKALLLFLVLAIPAGTYSQNYAQKIYETERAFEQAVAENGINAGFVKYLSPVGVMFFPEPANARDVYSKRQPTMAALTWNPIKIETSSNGALAYSIGNSIYRPKGKNDPNEIHGHYLTVWARQPNGNYLAALDTGIQHDKPAKSEPNWTAGDTAQSEPNPKNLFAGDSSIPYYRMAQARGMARALKTHGADDLYLLRQGKFPVVGRDAAVDFLGKQELAIQYAKRRSFIEAGDLAYVNSSYTITDKNGVEKERGSFVQVWKFRDGRWLIAVDILIPIPPTQS